MGIVILLCLMVFRRPYQSLRVPQAELPLRYLKLQQHLAQLLQEEQVRVQAQKHPQPHLPLPVPQERGLEVQPRHQRRRPRTQMQMLCRGYMVLDLGLWDIWLLLLGFFNFEFDWTSAIFGVEYRGIASTERLGLKEVGIVQNF